jgi:hypothetical protein
MGLLDAVIAAGFIGKPSTKRFSEVLPKNSRKKSLPAFVVSDFRM